MTAPIPPVLRPAGARYVNPRTGDYEVLSTGELARMPVVRQRVLLAVTTLLGSSSVVPGFGAQIPRKIDATWERRARNSIRLALSQLADVERVIRIDTILFAETNTVGRRQITISYTDLVTTENDAVRVEYP